MSDGLYLDASSLLSKWGFHDGDVPDEYADWLDEHDLPYPDDWHGLLTTLVRRRLMPLIDANVELETISTIHNPIRARTVNGLPVDQYDVDNEDMLADVSVLVPFAEVYELQASVSTVKNVRMPR